MTSRRGTLVEDGARELLQFNGYTVRVIPTGYNKRLPPAHLVASQPPGETRYIRIRKISHLAPSAKTVEKKCVRDLVPLRKYLSCHPGEIGTRCEIWIYTLGCGFRCFEVLTDGIREIPKLHLIDPVVRKAEGAA